MLHSRMTIASLGSLGVVSAALLFSSPAGAGDCKSATAIFADLWSQYGKVAIQVGCSIVAQETGSSTKSCYDDVAKYESTVQKMEAYWTSATAGAAWAKLGPRQLTFGGKLSGTIESVGERMFISSSPLDKDTVTIALTKTDGGEDITFTICKIDTKNTCTTLDSKDISSSAANGQVYKRTFTGVKGNIVTVHLQPTRVNVKKFSYTLEATKS